MLDTAVTKRLTVTLPDMTFEELEAWAEYQGRPTANLGAYLIESGIRQAKTTGEFKTLRELPPRQGKKPQ
ncbi:MAG: hypothetical protein WA919_12125 [Coleofasciculaceae cyanobacterium]